MQPRHFLTTARAVGYSAKLMTGILEEPAAQVSAVIDAVAGRLPQGFPEHIAWPVFRGMRECRDRIGQ
jgi:serine/threonine-protein kinase HipA